MKKIMLTFREGGENGGPYNSHLRIMNSGLSELYNFIPLYLPRGKIGVINPKLTLYIIKQVKKYNPDIVHFTGLELVGFQMALALKLIGYTKTIVAIHGSTSESLSYNKNKIKKRIIEILENLTLRWTKYSYGVSDYVSGWDKIVRYSNNYYGKIYNMPFNSIYASKSNEFFREQLDINKDSLIAISVGRVEVEKGFDTIADVIMNDKNDNLVYLIVGTGSYLDEMKKKLSNEIFNKKVYFLGYRNDVAHILSNCDICVMATLHETLCMALVEAGQAGLALIASDVGGIPEVINHGYNGFLVTDADTSGFNMYINQLLNDSKLLNMMKKNSKEYIDSKFNNQTIETQLNELYEGIK